MITRPDILTDGTITLKQQTQKDADALYAAVRESIPELMPWLPFAHPDYCIKETRGWLKKCGIDWKNNIAFNFAIANNGDGTIIGGCGLNQLNTNDLVANLGYWVRTSQSAKGVAPAATRLLAGWGFKALKLKRIEILIAVENRKSLRVAEKTGAYREGVLRNRLRLGGKQHDAVLFSLVPGEI